MISLRCVLGDAVQDCLLFRHTAHVLQKDLPRHPAVAYLFLVGQQPNQ